jgi:hypothetical protein
MARFKHDKIKTREGWGKTASQVTHFFSYLFFNNQIKGNKTTRTSHSQNRIGGFKHDKSKHERRLG